MSDEELVAAADAVGFPLLIKPSAGGGGKGMRLVESPSALPAELAAARREALGAFGDDNLLLERFVERPRHIEVQVLADTHGTVVHLGERECSLQRRHQKIVEEAPSPLLDDEQRAALGAQAVAAARACDYVNAGTVEFIVSGLDPDGRLLHGDEHPPPGRAPGHRAGVGSRPGGAAAPHRRRPGAAVRAVRPRPVRPRHRGEGVRRGSGGGLPALQRHGPAAWRSRAARTCGSTRDSCRAPRSGPPTTRCWPR